MLDIKTEQIRNLFKSKLLNEEFSIDRTGQKTIEVIGASFHADEPTIFGKPSDEYINHEILWYRSHSCNINDIYSGEREPPKAWQLSANKYGEINYELAKKRPPEKRKKAILQLKDIMPHDKP